MRSLLESSRYIEEVKKVANNEIRWEEVKGKTFVITGASGMIGSFFIDVLMYRNEMFHDEIKIIALYRNEKAFNERFEKYISDEKFMPKQQDVNEAIQIDGACDYIIHAASNTHPRQYASDPIGTITSNTIGTYQILELASKQAKARTLFLSSVEIYGENRGDVEAFSEDYCGYINCNTLRAGYPESKRCAEALCQAYIEAKNIDVVIARLSRVYGPTMRLTDSKAIAQFIKKAVDQEDIILKSKGNQLYSYTYVADVVSALMYVLISGETGEAYNIADEASNITLLELAKICAEVGQSNIVYEIPEEAEKKGYSTATKAILETSKIKRLGWKATKDIQKGIADTVNILNFNRR